MKKELKKQNQNKTFKSFQCLITPEKVRTQKLLFNYNKFGKLTFYISVVYKTTNVFFTFYCKSAKYPSKIFIFFKTSLGLENRDKIRKGLSPKVNMRGRRKNQFVHIRNKFNYFKAYIYDFIKSHPEIVIYKKFFMVWKIHMLDINIQNLIKQNFEISYSYNILNRILTEQIKYKILHFINLVPSINISDYEIINKFYVNKDNKGFIQELPLDFLFNKSKNNKLKDIQNIIEKKYNGFDNKNKIGMILDYFDMYNNEVDLYMEEEINNLQFLSFIFKFLNIFEDTKSIKDIRKEVFKNIRKENKSLSSDIRFALSYIDKNINLNEEDYLMLQPRIMHYFDFKFVHNGCRPKKSRRIKRTNK